MEVINTFSKGLNQDVSFINQPDGTYRNMKNGMLISYDGNHYVIEMSKGNKVIVTLQPRYTTDIDHLDLLPLPIGFISFIDKLVVFSTNNDSTTGYGEIGVISFTRINDDFVGTYVPYYHHAELNFTKLHKIEGFSFKENDNIQRVYWTDNFNEPRVFDIANPIFTTYIPSGSLVIGKQYMVLQGAIIYDSNEYGPTDATGTILGNIFTATVTGGTTYANSSTSSLVIEYYPLNLLDWTPDRMLGNIEFDSYGNGAKKYGTSIYFYRLSSPNDGIVSSWSYASSPMHVGGDNVYPSYTPSGDATYHTFSGNGNDTVAEISNKSIKVKISNVDTVFSVIELACAEYANINDFPTEIKIVNKIAVTGSEMIIEDNGSTNYGTVSVSDLTLFPASILKVKTLATNKNYNIVANLTEREEFELDLSSVVLSSYEYPLIAHGDLDLCINNLTYDPWAPTLSSNPSAGDVLPWSRWLVTEGDLVTNTVVYNGNNYVKDDVIVGVVGQTTITFSGTAKARPCVTKNRYTTNGGKRVEDAIEIKTLSWDYKDPAVASHVKGYWSNEKYRFGILFYDLKGNPFYVKYLGDFSMPDISTKGGLIREDAYINGGTSHIYSLNPSGIKVSGLEIPDSIIDKISGFSIVRAERDARIISQSLVLQLTSSGGELRPIAALDPDESFYPLDQSGHLIALMPDLLSGMNFKKTLGVVGDYMEEACWLDSYKYNGITSMRSDFGNENVVSKLFVPLPHDSLNSPIRKVKLRNVNTSVFYGPGEGTIDPNFDGASGILNNNIRTNVLSGPTTDADTCASGSPTLSLDDYNAAGCKKYIFRISDNMFKHYNISDEYFDTVSGAAQKIVMNYVKDIDPVNQYGGTSSSSISNTEYMSTGHYQPINAQVKTDTFNGVDKYIFDDIEIMGGDCFVNIIDEVYGLYNSGLGINNYAWTIYYPLECNTNYNLRRGRTPSRQGVSTFQTTGLGYYPNGVTFDDGGGDLRLEFYEYNKAYSTEGTFVKYPGLPESYRFTGKFEYRSRYSNFKNTGELVDSFRTFSVGNYKDFDGQRGQINNLKSRDSKLFYWQDHSVGYTPILERQLVGGDALGEATSLGVTGVIDRFDDIDTYFGNQHQHGLVETEFGFAWFDMRRRAFLVMGIGGKPEEISMILGLQCYFNDEFKEGNVSFPSTLSKIYNTNNLSIPEVPLLGYGIVGVYDPKFKMTYLTFKYERNNDNFDVVSVTNRDFTLGYNHVLNAFVGFFDYCPAIWHNHNDLVLSSNNPKNTKPYNTGMASTDYLLGDTVWVGNTEYICIKPVTISSYPGTLTPITGTNPLAPTSQYWMAINSENEIYLQTFGADLCKYYGKVWDHELDVIINPKSDIAMSPQNIQFKGGTNNWSSIYCNTDDQTAQDVNIRPTSVNYRWIDKAWFSNLPLPKNGEFVDYYFRIRFVFNNYVSNPTVSKNIQKLSQWIKTWFVGKK